MEAKITDFERKNEIIDACLNKFVSKGFYKTTSRDLSSAIKLQSGGIYYYFSSKDEIVVACAEKAIIRLEDAIIHPAIRSIELPDVLIDELYEHATQMAPTMRFFSQVCSVEEYRGIIAPTLYRLFRRYKLYAEMFSHSLDCEIKDIEPYVFIAVTAITNYMIYEEDSYIKPQMNMIKERVRYLLDNKQKRAVKTADGGNANDNQPN